MPSSTCSRSPKAVHGPGTDLAAAWGRRRRDELDRGRVDDLLAALAEHADDHGEARRCIGYLARNRDRMRYPEFRAMGLCIATGVVEGACENTVGMAPEILTVASNKVHIQGGWTRFARDDKPIVSNVVTYIATLVDGHWGIQSRFGTDTEVFWGNPEDDPVDHNVDVELNAKKAEGVVASALGLMGVDSAGATRYFHYPHLIIEPGDIESIIDAEALLHHLPASALLVRHVEAVQVGATGVIVSFRATLRERLVRGICLVNVDDDRWGMKGSSLVVV